MVIGMLGVGVITGKGRIGKPGMTNQDSVRSVNHSEDVLSFLLVKDSSLTVNDAQADASQVQKPKFFLMKGVGLATLVGVLNGSFLIPLKYAHKVSCLGLKLSPVKHFYDYGYTALPVYTLPITRLGLQSSFHIKCE